MIIFCKIVSFRNNIRLPSSRAFQVLSSSWCYLHDDNIVIHTRHPFVAVCFVNSRLNICRSSRRYLMTYRFFFLSFSVLSRILFQPGGNFHACLAVKLSATRCCHCGAISCPPLTDLHTQHTLTHHR